MPILDPSAASDAVPVHRVTKETLGARRAALSPAANAWLDANGFGGKHGEMIGLPTAAGGIEAVLIGADADAQDRAFQAARVNGLGRGTFRLGEGWDDPALSALGVALGGYRFGHYRKPPEQPGVRLVAPPEADLAELEATVEAVFLARDLINTPANDLGPEELAGAVRALGRRFGATVTVTDGQLLESGFPMIAAVGMGSDRPPCLADLVWGEADWPKVTLVGKGIVFDTGGLDIKPASGMALMKKDMGGAANALALASMIMAAGLPVRLRVLVAAAENSISGRAFRPGDVLRSRKGVSVEIGNTDAEGRLVLGDALALADEEAPELLIDFATLTGAARAALGPELPALYARDDALADALVRQGLVADDPMWRLPLWRGYEGWLKSDIAEISHISSHPFAGSITAALFLGRFVERAKSWAHIDLYAWNAEARPGRPKGGEAQTVRAISRYLAERYPG